MIASAAVIDWRIGRSRLLLPAVIHSVAAVAFVEIAMEWSSAWLLVGAVGISAVEDVLRWVRERRESRVLTLIPGGVAIDGQSYSAARAWLGPGGTAIWLRTATGRRNLMYVMRGEVSVADHAALRRHVKSFEFV